MTQPLSRRNFLWKSSLAAGAAAILNPVLHAKANGPRGVLATDSTDRIALDFISQFSTNPAYLGGGVAARLAGEIPAITHIAALLTDFSALRSALGTPKRSGIGKVHINGNQLTFSAGTREFVILLSHGDHPASPAAEMNTPVFRFAHQALQFRLATDEFSDPFQTARALKFLHESNDPCVAFEDLLEGAIEAKAFGLAKGADFDLRKSRVLSLDGSSMAFGIVAAFSKKLSILAETVSQEDMTELLDSNLLNTAFATHFGQSVKPAIGRFETLRSRAGSGYSDAAVWMACILETQVREGTVGRFLSPDNRLRQLAARDAMQQAIQLLV